MKDEIKPKFQKDLPDNWKEYMDIHADDAFKSKYLIRYGIIVSVGLLALLAPMLIYMAYVLFINPAKNSPILLLGLVGTFMIGAGLFNIVGAWVQQYMGHKITAICLIIGSLITLLSIVLLYH